MINITKDELQDLYINKKLSIVQISKLKHINDKKIFYLKNKFNIKTINRNERNILKKDDCLQILKQLFKQNNGKLYKKDLYEKNCKYTLDTYKRYFGSCDKAAKLVGYKFLIYKPQKKWIKKELLNELKRLFLLDKNLSKGKINLYYREKKTFLTKDTLKNYFGSLDTAANIIKYSFIKKKNIYTKDSILYELKKIFKENSKITKPKLKLILKQRNLFNFTIIRYNFKSINNALNLIGYKCLPSINYNLYKAHQAHFGKNEVNILNIIEKKKNIKIERHPFIKTKKYFKIPDGIDYKNKIIYEVNENHHKYRQQSDKNREQQIKEILPDFNFVYINEKEFLKQTEVV